MDTPGWSATYDDTLDFVNFLRKQLPATCKTIIIDDLMGLLLNLQVRSGSHFPKQTVDLLRMLKE